jgi:hypothetical protein
MGSNLLKESSSKRGVETVDVVAYQGDIDPLALLLEKQTEMLSGDIGGHDTYGGGRRLYGPERSVTNAWVEI